VVLKRANNNGLSGLWYWTIFLYFTKFVFSPYYHIIRSHSNGYFFVIMEIFPFGLKKFRVTIILNNREKRSSYINCCRRAARGGNAELSYRFSALYCEQPRRMEYVIDIMKPEDWQQVRTIYLEGIGTGNSTFEADAPDWDKWDAAHLREHRLVLRQGDSILAWAALSPVSTRCVYSGVAELSLYVTTACRGKGIGSALLKATIDSTEKAGLWTLQGGIFPENTSSRHLVRKHDFKEIGRREKIGKMTYGALAGTWRDVILVERRSAITGID
jgi:L-amino acid N-acyltransferase YncA